MKKIFITADESGKKLIRFDKVCPHCGGDGYDWDGGQCFMCGGLGEI